jgi:hypothetical protein
MRRERRRRLTRSEWAAITSGQPVVRGVLDRGQSGRPEKSHSPGLIGPARSEDLAVESNKRSAETREGWLDAAAAKAQLEADLLRRAAAGDEGARREILEHVREARERSEGKP